jgi:hypothetical protein
LESAKFAQIQKNFKQYGGNLALAKQAENIQVGEKALFTIKSVQTWRAVLQRATAWKTARYTKGDIEATVVGVTDTDGTIGYGYMPSMSIVGESPLSSESLIQGLLIPVMEGQSFIGIQPVCARSSKFSAPISRRSSPSRRHSGTCWERSYKPRWSISSAAPAARKYR